MFFTIISALHVSGGFSAHHQGLIKLYVRPWVLSCFPAVYRCSGWVGAVFMFFAIKKEVKNNNLFLGLPTKIKIKSTEYGT
jgi:hypothetical protein